MPIKFQVSRLYQVPDASGYGGRVGAGGVVPADQYRVAGRFGWREGDRKTVSRFARRMRALRRAGLGQSIFSHGLGSARSGGLPHSPKDGVRLGLAGQPAERTSQVERRNFPE